jgi:hypothetical protein
MIDAAQVKSIAQGLGADACGIARAEAFAGAPEGFRPTDIYSRCRSVIVFLKAMPAEIAQAENPVPYSNTAFLVYAEIDRLALELVRELARAGVPAVPVPQALHRHSRPRLRHLRLQPVPQPVPAQRRRPGAAVAQGFLGPAVAG